MTEALIGSKLTILTNSAHFIVAVQFFRLLYIQVTLILVYRVKNITVVNDMSRYLPRKLLSLTLNYCKIVFIRNKPLNSCFLLILQFSQYANTSVFVVHRIYLSFFNYALNTSVQINLDLRCAMIERLLNSDAYGIGKELVYALICRRLIYW